MSNLQPCPFCGAGAKVQDIGTGHFRVMCKKCPTSVGRYWFVKKDDAINAWNRRANDER